MYTNSTALGGAKTLQRNHFFYLQRQQNFLQGSHRGELAAAAPDCHLGGGDPVALLDCPPSGLPGSPSCVLGQLWCLRVNWEMRALALDSRRPAAGRHHKTGCLLSIVYPWKMENEIVKRSRTSRSVPQFTWCPCRKKLRICMSLWWPVGLSVSFGRCNYFVHRVVICIILIHSNSGLFVSDSDC